MPRQGEGGAVEERPAPDRGIDDSLFPHRLVVDYVRVYPQK